MALQFHPQFLLRRFSVQLALGALALFVLSLSWGVTVNSLPLAAKVAGWDWRPMTSHPLVWLLTLPLRVLPASWIPIALNLLSAVCGAVVIGVLARSLELLPRRRPLNPDGNWRDRLPGFLVCALCGLEFSFWQEATAATSEMLDLLLFAGAVWSLLEYRDSKRSRWLDRAAILWGLGLAENWMMALTFPVFVVVMVWLRRKRILDRRFPVRMCLLGLAGFSIYFVPPLVNGLLPGSPWGFGEAWFATLKVTRHTFGTLYHQFGGKRLPLTLGLTAFYLVPILPCLMRSPENKMRFNSSVVRLEIWIYHLLRLALLLVCLWLAFDPTLGPRTLAATHLGLEVPLLSFDYLNALGAAFVAGDLLLTVHSQLEARRQRGWLRRSRHWLAPTMAGGVALIATALLVRNAPAIARVNRQSLTAFGALQVRSLPSDGGIVLCDDLQRLLSFQAALSRSEARRKWTVVDTASLRLPAYRATLHRIVAKEWLSPEIRPELSADQVLQLLDRASRSNRVVWLQPSFGEFFEGFYLKPRGAVFEVNARTVGHPGPTPLTTEEVNRTEKLWDTTWESQLEALGRPVSGTNAGWLRPVQKICRAVHIGPATLQQTRLLSEWFSAAINSWGVELQRAGRLPEARQRFGQALVLNTNNMAARLNLTTCTNLLAGARLSLAGVDKAAATIDDGRKLFAVMGRCGLLDDPVYCYLLGLTLERLNLPRQAALEYERSHALAPDEKSLDFTLLETYARTGNSDKVLKLVSLLRRSNTNSPAVFRSLDLDLSFLEARAWYTQSNYTRAHDVLQGIQKQHSNDDLVTIRLAKSYLAFGDYTNALQVFTVPLARRPDDPLLLSHKADTLVQLGDMTNALPLLNRALAVTNSPLARLNRAAVALQLGELATAEADFLLLEKGQFESVPVQLGLAKIATRRGDTNQAFRRLTFCLSNAPPGSALWEAARARFDALQPDGAKSAP